MIATALLTAAVLAADVDPAALTAYNRDRLQTNQTSMFVLGSWATANLVASGIGWGVTSNERLKGVFQASLVWNVINLGLAIGALASNWNTDPASLDFKTSFSEGQTIEKIFLINLGLDVAYVVGGGALWHYGNTSAKELIAGWGIGALVQGAFLLLFDGAMFLINNRINSRAWAMFPTPTR